MLHILKCGIHLHNTCARTATRAGPHCETPVAPLDRARPRNQDRGNQKDRAGDNPTKDTYTHYNYCHCNSLSPCAVSFPPPSPHPSPTQAAFLLPTITRLIKEEVQGASQNETQSPEVLIISPTRELTLQIYNEARKFVYSSVYRPVVVYGGTSVGHQLSQVERGCNIVVGTPGRLLDFLGRGKVRGRGGRET